MNYHVWRALALICFICLFTVDSIAQESCPEKLLRSESAYETGDFQETITLAQGCAIDGDESNQAQAYRLVSMAYLALLQKEKAVDAAVKMLEIQPEYHPNLLKDPKEFTDLLQEIEVIPQFSLGGGVLFGIPMNGPQQMELYAPADYTKNYSNASGSHFGIATTYNFTSKHGLAISAFSKTWKFDLDYEVFGNQVDIEETIRTIDLPVTYQYTPWPHHIWMLGIGVGAYGNVLVNSFNDLSIKNGEVEKEIKHYSSTARRNKLNFGLCGNLGVSRRMGEKWGNGQFRVDVSFFKGLTNITNTDGRYNNATLIYDFFHLDDDLQLNNLGVSIGYQLNIKYKVKR